jgi:hypothetical protein
MGGDFTVKIHLQGRGVSSPAGGRKACPSIFMSGDGRAQGMSVYEGYWSRKLAG